MGRTSYEALAEGDECGKMSYRIRRKVMELRPEVVHNTSEERMGRQGETSGHVAEQKNALSLLWRRLHLAFRQPPRLIDDHAVLHQLQHVVLHHRGGEEVPLDPARRQRPLPPLSGGRPLLLLLLRLKLAGLPLRHGEGDGSAEEEGKEVARGVQRVAGRRYQWEEDEQRNRKGRREGFNRPLTE